MYLFASRIYLFIAFIVGFAQLPGNPATAKTRYHCPDRLEPLYFSVKTIPRNITYNLKLNRQQIARLANRTLSARPKRGGNTLGLTSVGHALKYSYKFSTRQISRNRYCARLLAVEIEIQVTKLEVYSLKKYRRGSCQYNAIVDHEHEHVATFQHAIDTLEEIFTHQAPEIIDNSPPGIGASALQAQFSMKKTLKYNINKIRDRIIRKMNVRNAQIDTPLSYKRISQKCSKW